MSQVRGGLVLEWRAACDGWISQQRLGFVAEADDGPGFAYDVRFSSWESLDNTQLRFNVRSFDGPNMHEEFRGLAELMAPGGTGAVHYQIPDGQDVSLPAGTISRRSTWPTSLPPHRRASTSSTARCSTARARRR